MLRVRFDLCGQWGFRGYFVAGVSMKSSLMILVSVLCLFSLHAFANESHLSSEGSPGPQCYIGTDYCDPSFRHFSADQFECGSEI
jgi:hypothetical protein